MKKIVGLILTLLIFAGLNFAAQAATQSATVNFTWDKLTQTERDTDIQNIQKKVFTENTIYSYDKEAFQKKYEDYKKDKNFKENMLYARLGDKNLQDRIIVPFYVKKLLYGYGIIYKSDLKRCYYYSAFGGLYLIEIFTNDYNKYPAVSYQYDKKGRLTSVVYALSENDEYIYSSTGFFLGRWYKENYYSSKGNVIMTRALPQ